MALAAATALQAIRHWTSGHSCNLLLNCFQMDQCRTERSVRASVRVSVCIVQRAHACSKNGQNYAIINKYQSNFDYIVFGSFTALSISLGLCMHAVVAFTAKLYPLCGLGMCMLCASIIVVYTLAFVLWQVFSSPSADQRWLNKNQPEYNTMCIS